MLDTLHHYLKFDVNHLDANGQTLLFYAAKAGMNSLIGHIVKDLGANPNIIDTLVGQTAIFYAAAYGKCETVEFLARLGADVNF
jgi:ankyrin repeat protein